MDDDDVDSEHGTEILAKLWGADLGIARAAEIVWVKNSAPDNPDNTDNVMWEKVLEGLVRVLGDVVANSRTTLGKTILNMSFGYDEDAVTPPGFLRMFRKYTIHQRCWYGAGAG